MEFWGIEIKAGEPLKVAPKPEHMIHLSQAALGESKKEKGNESVPLYVKADNKKILLGTLSQENFPQIQFDIILEKEVEISHNWKNGSVYLSGYQIVGPEDDEESFFGPTEEEESEDEEILPLVNAENGVFKAMGNVKNLAKPNTAKPVGSGIMAKPVADEESDDEDESDDDDDEDEEDESDGEEESEEGMSVDEDSEDEDDSESEDEETPKKAEKGKKRQSDSALKTPVPSKKGKVATPQKTDGKKGAPHTATPHPAKGGKTSANGNTSNKPQTPKSGGKFSCNSCERSFASDTALQSHSKAKHAGK